MQTNKQNNAALKHYASTKYNEWTKKLGQQHWQYPYPDRSGETFCGSPMLGNNYANLIKSEYKTPCPDCVKAIFELEKQKRRSKENA